MIIYLDKTIFEHAESLNFSEEEYLLFSDLAIAHQRGRCFLCGDLSCLEWFADNLTGLHSSIYKRISHKQAETKAIINIVESILVLSYSTTPLLPSFLDNKARVLSIQNAIDYRLSSECTLIGENLNDCCFYKLIAERYIHSKNIRGVQLSFHEELGGGDTMNTVFKKCVTVDKTLALCLVDCDIKYGKTKTYPANPARGNTVNKLTTTYKELQAKINPSTYELYCLPIHEVENLIPTSVLDSVATSSVPEISAGVTYLHTLFGANLIDAILCYDFKYGDAKLKDPPAIQYWSEIKETTSVTVLPRLSAKVLEPAIAVLQGNTHDTENTITVVPLDSYLVPFWNTIGQKVFSWGCANLPIRA